MSQIETELKAIYQNQDVVHIDSIESEVYRVGDMCIKVYLDTKSITQETLEKYQYLTNTIADTISGHSIYISTPETTYEYTIDIVRIEQIQKLSTGHYYTVSRYIEGPTLDSILSTSTSDTKSIWNTYYEDDEQQNHTFVRSILSVINTYFPRYSELLKNQLIELNVKLKEDTLFVTDILSYIGFLSYL
jgi:hypothetical protein